MFFFFFLFFFFVVFFFFFFFLFFFFFAGHSKAVPLLKFYIDFCDCAIISRLA